MERITDIVAGLIPWADHDYDILSGISEEDLHKVREVWENRISQLLPESDEMH